MLGDTAGLRRAASAQALGAPIRVPVGKPVLGRLLNAVGEPVDREPGVVRGIAFASENAAWFAAMQSAHDNVAKKVEELRQDARQARQNEITTELLDLATGVEAQALPRLHR